MTSPTPKIVYRQDYQPFPYELQHASLEFDLDPNTTTVRSELRFSAKPGAGAPRELVLDGTDLELLAIGIDGQKLAAAQYQLSATSLRITPPAASGAFTLQITSRCSPAKNTALMGLYVSGAQLFTQCEAQGFRRITWFPDRPDVMATFDTTLRADPKLYPILLSNGNLLEQTTLADGRIQARWQDPFPKPSYLFALVAGDFDLIERRLKTASGREVLLQLYSDRGWGEQTHWAMDCLEHALRWDERRFGLELDLERFMVVAARDFNMGAMENKGLNIFNAAYVLADPQATTDAAYRGIEAVIGHEYFHNWTGNRVTCQDWFQLSLKEGLTVFRDQEFSADMLAAGLPPHEAASARAVKRIDDVQVLRSAQFSEDAGPMAHPIRPDSYQEISNFYTATVYEKGAEVIRMYHTLLGEAGFRAGIDEYFRRHDGQAVTCEHFVQAMESVYSQQNPGQDLQQFRQWYSQAGTPRVRVNVAHDPAQASCTITLEQSNPPAGLEPARPKPPLHIPLAIGLLDSSGASYALQAEPGGARAALQPLADSHDAAHTLLLELRAPREQFVIHNLPERPVLSLLRGFSAPVILQTEHDDAELCLLAAHDPDPFARWDACQQAGLRHLQAAIDRHAHDPAKLPAPHTLQKIFASALADASLSPAYLARLLELPAAKQVLESTSPIAPQSTVAALEHARSELGRALAPQWLACYRASAPEPDAAYSPEPVAAGKRALRNLALRYLLAAAEPGAIELARDQYQSATNMTASLGALSALVQHTPTACADLLQDFYQKWRHDPLVLDRWFALQASAPDTSAAQARALLEHPDFSLNNPNRARALVFRFCMENHANLHTPAGHQFWVDQVLALDAINPEIASRLARAFDSWARFEPQSRAGMLAALRTVAAAPNLSRNTAEIVGRALNLEPQA